VGCTYDTILAELVGVWLTRVIGFHRINKYPELVIRGKEQEIVKKTEQQLLVRRNELLQRLAAIRKDLSSGLDSDSEEQAAQMQNFEVLQEIERLAREELNLVEEELTRLRGAT
jgi:hypothetical protein